MFDVTGTAEYAEYAIGIDEDEPSSMFLFQLLTNSILLYLPHLLQVPIFPIHSSILLSMFSYYHFIL
jgi:hypothetical protein